MNRKDFLKTMGVGAVGTVVNPLALFSAEPEKKIENQINIEFVYSNGFRFVIKNDEWIIYDKDSFAWSMKNDNHYIDRLLIGGRKILDQIISAKNPWDRFKSILRDDNSDIISNLQIKNLSIDTVMGSINDEYRVFKGFVDWIPCPDGYATIKL